MNKLSFPTLLCLSLLSVSHAKSDSTSTTSPPSLTAVSRYPIAIKQLSDEEYPDNPDLGFMSKQYDHHYFSTGSLSLPQADKGTFTFNSEKGSVSIRDIDLMEFIPSVPEHLKKDPYLTQLAIINQEWNRNQIRLRPSQFDSPNQAITRVDLARNCLNSYLWEIILYTKEEGTTLPLAHGWFDFPKELYKSLFKDRNGIPFETFRSHLEHWVDPASKPVNLDLLRTIIQETPVASFQDKSSSMYPLKKARLKKKKEIITPKEFSCMKDFHSDKTLFATFSEPGFYNRASPRKTELGRLQSLDSLQVSLTKTPYKNERSELVLSFSDDQKRITKLFLGGLDLNSFPKLNPEQANDGYKISMGFGNHTFYETYEEHLAWKSHKNEYYGFFSNEKNEWLDSHKIGVDGPIFHWDQDNPKKLHLWLLSFERHALVGHYEILFQ